MSWSRGGLPREAYEELRPLVRDATVLAWGRGDGVLAVGLPGQLAVRDADGWRLVAWHEVDRARWDAGTQELTWSGAEADRVHLTEPGRLPMLVRDRVEASIVVSERVTAGTVDVRLTGRRDLADPDAPLVWAAVAADGRGLDRPGVREVVDRRLAELRADLEG